MDIEHLQQAKARCLADINEALPRYADRLNGIDARLTAYITDAVSNDGSHANLYELLGIRKELRLMDTYQLNTKRVQKFVRAIEGIWRNGRHQRGGLKFDTPRGNQHVRLMPYQVWCLFGIYGFLTEVSMERPYVEGDQLLPSEFVRDGIVWDRRRLTTEAHIFQTRKSGKTEFGAAIDFIEVCFLGPVNGQALICANSHEQSKIAYKAVKEFATQIDPTCMNRMGGKYFRLTADSMNWQPGNSMKGEIKTLAAGGKISKDGLYASLVHADEHGSARYVAGRSDMQELVNVCAGSMGPRRESLIMHTTTAGLVNEGPYKNQIETVEQLLLDELDRPLGQPCQTEEDEWFAFLLRLDPWEVNYDLPQLDDPELFRKVNRSIGITVQPTWYRKRLHDAEKDEDVRKEVLTKDFNIWQTGRITQWIKSDRIRTLQRDRRIEDCRFADGWQVFAGMDFSLGDDLFAVAYLAVDYTPGDSMAGRFFADCDCWVLEETMKQSPNRPLYERWVEQGWLHVCPGEVFDSMYAINRIAAVNEAGVNIRAFGYDPAQSIQPINQLKAWLQTLFQARGGHSAKDIADAIRQMVLPVSQNAMAQNPRIGELEHMILEREPWLLFSQNPMWPWMFGNCACEVTTSDLRRLVKGGPRPTHKIDGVAALVDALWCFDLAEGRIDNP